MATWVSDGIVDQPLLDEAGEGGEHQAGGNALLVEQLEAGPRLAEGGDARHRLAGELAQRAPLGVVAGVERHVRARPGDDLEGGVGDELGEPVAHDELLPAAELDEADEVPVRRRQVPGQRVLGLVEVVVRVEHREVDSLFHALVVLRREARLTWLR